MVGIRSHARLSELAAIPPFVPSKPVEVDGTPQLFQGAYIDIPITVAASCDRSVVV